MECVKPKTQSVNHVDVSKAVGTSQWLVPVNTLEEMRQFRDQSRPWRDISLASLKEVRVATRPIFVSLYIISEGLFILHLA